MAIIPTMASLANSADLPALQQLGRALWRGMQICTVNYPTASAYFGNYVMYTLIKKY